MWHEFGDPMDDFRWAVETRYTHQKLLPTLRCTHNGCGT